jgi:hypothetical protein
MIKEEKKKLRYVIAFEKGSLLIGSSTKRKRDLVKILPIYRKQWKNAVIEKRLIDVPRYTKEEKIFAEKFSNAINGVLRK